MTAQAGASRDNRGSGGGGAGSGGDGGIAVIDRELERGLRCVQRLLADPTDALAFHGMIRHLTGSIKDAFSTVPCSSSCTSSSAGGPHSATSCRDDGASRAMQARRERVATIVQALDAAGRPLAARAMLSQAFICAARGTSNTDVAATARAITGPSGAQRNAGKDIVALCERLEYGVWSLRRTSALYTSGISSGVGPTATADASPLYSDSSGGQRQSAAAQQQQRRAKLAEEDPGFWRNYTLDVDRTVAGCMDALLGLLTLLLAAGPDSGSAGTDTSSGIATAMGAASSARMAQDVEETDLLGLGTEDSTPAHTQPLSHAPARAARADDISGSVTVMPHAGHDDAADDADGDDHDDHEGAQSELRVAQDTLRSLARTFLIELCFSSSLLRPGDAGHKERAVVLRSLLDHAHAAAPGFVGHTLGMEVAELDDLFQRLCDDD